MLTKPSNPHSEPDRGPAHRHGALAALFLVALVLAPLGASHARTTEETIRFTGVARTEDGRVAYIEEHEVRVGRGRELWSLTQYSRPDGEAFADLESDYSRYPYLPHYQFRDRRFGRVAGIDLEAGGIRAFGRRDENAEMKDWPLEPDAGLIAGQGLNYYLRDHLAEFAGTDSTKSLRFFIPLTGRSVTFRVRRLDRVDEDPGEITLAVEPDAWWIRLLAGRLEVSYELATGRLVRYQGPSNILDDERSDQTVEIVYQYR